MTAVTRDLYIEQGATFTLGFNWYRSSTVTPGTPGLAYDLTGATARMQIRRKASDPTVLVDATTENGKIVLGGVDGRIDVRLTDVDTNALTVKSAVYDFEIVLGADTHRLLQGAVTVSPNVTQP